MSDMPARDAKLVELLNEAFTKEKQLETALAAHVEVTTRDHYAKRLKAHLKETKSHATKVSQRIKQLGGRPETVSIPGPDGLTKAAESVSEVIGKAKAAAQGPMHTVRGSGEQWGRGERRGLTGACRAGDEHQAARLLGELVQRGGDAQLLERLQLGGDETKGGADGLALEVDVDAEAREAGDRVREVELALQLEVLLLLAREDAVEELLCLLGRECRELLEPLDVPAHANDRGSPRRHMEIGGIALHHVFEQLID